MVGGAPPRPGRAGGRQKGDGAGGRAESGAVPAGRARPRGDCEPRAVRGGGPDGSPCSAAPGGREAVRAGASRRAARRRAVSVGYGAGGLRRGGVGRRERFGRA